MNLKIKHILLILIGFVVLCTPVRAQFEKKAQVGMKFLSNPVGAEAIGRGTAGINSTFNSNGIFWNPALPSLMNSNIDVSLNYQKWIADISYNALAASVNAFNFGVVTLSGTIVNYGELYQTIRSGEGYLETGTFTPTAFTLGLGFSQKVSDRFSYGLNAKYVYQDLGSAWVSTGDSLNDPNFTKKMKKYDMGTWAIDIGTFYDFGYKGITFAATLSNISREQKYEDEDFPLPFSVNFGATVSPIKFLVNDLGDHDLIFMVESHHPRDFGEQVKFGLEYNYMKTFYLRAGQVTNQDERGFTAGVGFRKTISSFPIRIDYAYQNGGIFGGLHYFTVAVSY
ncbi:MAG: PorV/PorQ family protein [Bacteroidota bacterium]|nr:PorV/PorQ family protein [Bacteroidota bacterium]MDP4190349.1 PorV/PorQ family protein [Bacteroidota bacterium]MDP4193523.1 PorV/PorQ family protein [Bacteroidota bacterium]